MSKFHLSKTGKTAFLTKAAMIAAAYAALTLILAPISYGQIQFRVSEALTVLPFFMPEAIPGLFIGCIIANLFTPNIMIIDVVFGSLATLAAAICTALFAKLGKKGKWLAPLPPVVFNAFIIGAVIAYSSSVESGAFFVTFLFNALCVGISELIITYIFGIPILFIYENILTKIKNNLKKE